MCSSSVSKHHTLATVSHHHPWEAVERPFQIQGVKLYSIQYVRWIWWQHLCRIRNHSCYPHPVIAQYHLLFPIVSDCDRSPAEKSSWLPVRSVYRSSIWRRIRNDPAAGERCQGIQSTFIIRIFWGPLSMRREHELALGTSISSRETFGAWTLPSFMLESAWPSCRWLHVCNPTPHLWESTDAGPRARTHDLMNESLRSYHRA